MMCGTGTAQVNVEEGPTVLQGRFHPFNLMHMLHDDVLGLYDVLRTFVPAKRHVALVQS